MASVDTSSRVEDGESWRIISKVSTLRASGFLLPQGFEVDLDLYIYCLLAQERHLISRKNILFENRRYKHVTSLTTIMMIIKISTFYKLNNF